MGIGPPMGPLGVHTRRSVWLPIGRFEVAIQTRLSPQSGSARKNASTAAMTGRSFWFRSGPSAAGTLAQQYHRAPGDDYQSGAVTHQSPDREYLFGKHQKRQRGDPRHVHDTTNKQQGHQQPATTDAVRAVRRTHP